MRWTETEYQALLNAIEKGGSTKGVIEMATQVTNRSNESVKRKLTKIGYLRSCGQSFSVKQGFAR